MALYWDMRHNLCRTDWRLELNHITDEPFSKIVLFPFMKDMGIIPSDADITVRENILKTLQMMVKDWITDVGRRYNKNLNAEVIPYGSYGLEVYSRTSDIDILVIAPKIASLQYDFFVQFRKLVETIPGASNVRSIETAKVPLLKFKMHGVEVDVACARLNSESIPTAENVHNEHFCIQSAVDSQSRMTLESVMSNWNILQVVAANREIFIEATRLLKYWAISRGIYGNVNCYLGGIHLSVLIAYACSRYRGKSLAGFVAYFFFTFAHWIWRFPVKLHMNRTAAPDSLILCVQKPGTDVFCPSNITKGTILKIKNEFMRGYNMTRDLSWKWSLLLERFPYETVYQRFIKVRISVLESDLEKWLGFVKSRLAVLIRLLEEDNIVCDPELTEFMDLPSAKSTGFQSKNRVYLWGIVGDGGKMYNLARAESEWRSNLVINGDGSSGEIKLAVIPLSVFQTYKIRNLVRS